MRWLRRLAAGTSKRASGTDVSGSAVGSGVAGDRLLRLLAVGWGLDTVVSLALSLAGPAGATAGWGGQRAPGWIGLVWFALLLALVGRLLQYTRRLRRALTDRDEQLAAVLATSGDWRWESDIELVVTSASPAISQLLGRRPEQIVGRSLLELISGDDLEQTRASLASVLGDGPGWGDVEARWRHGEGHLVTLSGSAAAIRGARGAVVGLRGVCRFAPDDTIAFRRLAGITHRTRNLLATRSMPIALQPIVALDTGRWVGVEALARFPDHRRPDVWFAEAHEVGLGVDLELLAVQAAVALLPELPAPVFLSVNASPALILDHRLREALTAPGVTIERIVIEITEHAAVQRYDDIHAALLPLRERGLALAIDDTGAGYASFTHVLHLRPDTIKLDRALIADIDTDPALRAFVTAITLLALELGATVTAEGVENTRELATLACLGVDHAQGYLLAHPATDPRRWRSWPTRSWPTAAVPAQRPAAQARLASTGP
ncbi:MAG: sensor domain-containing phosphodiesterase [Mycobacteriales bacterium]